MKSKIVRMSFFLVALLSLTGCLGTSETDEEADNTGGNGQVRSDDDSEESVPVPPSLRIMIGEETLEPVLGTYSWSVENDDGTFNGVEADSAAPPELVRMLDPVPVTSDTEVTLDFEEEPERYTVRIWDVDNTILSESTDVDLSGDGEVIYEIWARWPQGSASYAFSLIIE